LETLKGQPLHFSLSLSLGMNLEQVLYVFLALFVGPSSLNGVKKKTNKTSACAILGKKNNI
jgi:hypothetical protein